MENRNVKNKASKGTELLTCARNHIPGIHNECYLSKPAVIEVGKLFRFLMIQTMDLHTRLWRFFRSKEEDKAKQRLEKMTNPWPQLVAILSRRRHPDPAGISRLTGRHLWLEIPLLFVYDANAHYEIWASNNTNWRGGYLFNSFLAIRRGIGTGSIKAKNGTKMEQLTVEK